MNIEDFRNYCIQKNGTTEEFPFDEVTLAFKVMGKIYALTSINSERFTVNLKCDPEYAIELRERYEEVIPGYHMSKKHWNTVDFEGSMDLKLLCELIDHSYEMVVKGLKKADREFLKQLEAE